MAVDGTGDQAGSTRGVDGGGVRRRELAAFLRSRRERIAPEQVGLPRGRRRRTPGLRREEVAHLSAVGVTWYTWLEQARDIQVSPQVLDALARALLLDPTERSHLFALAGAADPTPGKECSSPVSAPLRQMLEQLEPYPACVQNARYDVLAYNRTYGKLLCDLDALPYEDRNCLWLTFTNPEWRAALVDREQTLRLMTANFRAAMAGHVADPVWKALVKRLQSASEEFCEVWDRHEVVAPATKIKRFRHPQVGLLHCNPTRLWLGSGQGPRLGVYVPHDEETRERMERLLARIRDNEEATFQPQPQFRSQPPPYERLTAR
ncbi:helix-turn-helix domain-containing protein [Streptomyces sp. N2-109]|uniref:Helix-turn-helix domain-containing protein n=1 Tax=Streptomyces gossypii TaxID=2883101 RepID=A0ABT2JRL0_9ACTN|nr:helix-turn-helix domain-containing protein [Streptomyces gossypii]MCT2590343.1 helix-turn-helix domain-containing protein [Streptomyces gossypii]